MMNAIAQTALPFPLVRRGKVRDVYDVGDDRLLIVATDRISAFDVVMPQPIPDKGAVLTQITAWWLQHGGSFAPNHLISAADREIAAQVPALRDSSEVWSVSAVPTWSTGACSLTSAENCAESATTAKPHTITRKIVRAGARP